MYSVTEQTIEWLDAHGYTAATYPPDGVDEFVTVERTGGNVSDMVDFPTVAIQTWAQTEPRAEEMALEIRNIMLTGSRPYGVATVSVNSGPYPFFDEDTRLPRYQIAFDMVAQLTD